MPRLHGAGTGRSRETEREQRACESQMTVRQGRPLGAVAGPSSPGNGKPGIGGGVTAWPRCGSIRTCRVNMAMHTVLNKAAGRIFLPTAPEPLADVPCRAAGP